MSIYHICYIYLNDFYVSKYASNLFYAPLSPIYPAPITHLFSLSSLFSLGDGSSSPSVHFIDDFALPFDSVEDDDEAPPPPTQPPVGIHTRLRHLMKESRKSVVMGAELSNLRSFRTRAREEAQARHTQTALELEKQAKTDKYVNKRRRMSMQTIVVTSSDNHSGNTHMHIHSYIHAYVVMLFSYLHLILTISRFTSY